MTGNNWEIGNTTLTLNIANNYAKQWDIGVNNDNLRFNRDYNDLLYLIKVVIYQVEGQI